METILKGIEQGGALGIAVVFAGLWFLEVKERWDREKEAAAFRNRSVNAQIRLSRILTKLYVALSQDDSELDNGDADEPK